MLRGGMAWLLVIVEVPARSHWLAVSWSVVTSLICGLCEWMRVWFGRSLLAKSMAACGGMSRMVLVRSLTA